MFNCSNALVKYHDTRVTLNQSQKSSLSESLGRICNLIQSGLKSKNNPKPIKIEGIGSYSMKTLVQQDDNNYNIDVGVVFEKSDLFKDGKSELAPFEVRTLVRNAIKSKSKNIKVSIKDNNVQVYESNFILNILIFRRTTISKSKMSHNYLYELASSEWKQSSPFDVTTWFNENNQFLSNDFENGRQLRRVVRLIKKFTTSQVSWKNKVICGLGITKLVVDNFHGNVFREDLALYKTLVSIKQQLDTSLNVSHPIIDGETISKGRNDSRVKFFRKKVKWATNVLAPLTETDCSAEQAAKCWDKIFNTNFFIEVLKESENAFIGQTFGSIPIINIYPNTNSVIASGGGRYA